MKMKIEYPLSILVLVVFCLICILHFNEIARLRSDQAVLLSKIEMLSCLTDSLSGNQSTHNPIPMDDSITVKLDHLASVVPRVYSELVAHELNHETVIDNELSKLSNWVALFSIICGLVIVLLGYAFTVNSSHNLDTMFKSERAKTANDIEEVKVLVECLWNSEPIDIRKLSDRDDRKTIFRDLSDAFNKLLKTAKSTKKGRTLNMVIWRTFEMIDNENLLSSVFIDRYIYDAYNEVKQLITRYKNQPDGSAQADIRDVQQAIERLIKLLDSKWMD